jgi:hypothetical protein
MKIGVVNRDNFLDNNRIFILGLLPDGLIDFWFYLKMELSKIGIDICTVDSFTSDKNFDLLIFNEIPSRFSSKYNLLDIPCRKFLFLGDCPLVIPENYNFHNYDLFEKIFTWNNDLLISDEKKFIKLNFTLPLKKLLQPELVQNQRHKDVCLIAGNKKINGVLELYTYRNLLINFLSDKDISFHLYGSGWNKIRFSSHNLSGKILNRLFTNFKVTPPNSWKGIAKTKLEVYQHFNSSFAIENAMGYSGYVTEKIIHSLLGFTIPLYLGDSNIKQLIPSEFYIDIKNLSFEDLLDVIVSNREKNNLQHRKRLLDFILNDGLSDFDSDYFVSRFIKFL